MERSRKSADGLTSLSGAGGEARGSLGRIQQSGRDSGRQEAADDEDGRWRLIDGGGWKEERRR